MISEALAFNPQGLDRLRFQATKEGGKESLRAAAQQFESYFLQLMMRSMRQSLSQDGLFDSQETRMFSDMFDQQISQSISKSKGMGMTDMLVSQLEAQMQAGKSIKIEPRPYDLPPVNLPQAAQPATARPPLNMPVMTQQIAETPAATGDSADQPLNRHNFVSTLWPHAVDAAREIGVSPHFLLAQAALESGWGKGELRGADGSNSYNLFNIKAGNGWGGKRVESLTTEYAQGVAGKQTAQFRAYDSYAEAFADYARLLKDNPRYAGAVGQGGDAAGFARGLQNGGYATDPQYADKLQRVINSSAFRERLAASALA